MACLDCCEWPSLRANLDVTQDVSVSESMIVIRQTVWIIDLLIQIILDFRIYAHLVFRDRCHYRIKICWALSGSFNRGCWPCLFMCTLYSLGYVFLVLFRNYFWLSGNGHNVHQVAVDKHQVRLWPAVSVVLTPSQWLSDCLYQGGIVLVIPLDRGPDRLMIHFINCLLIKRWPHCSRHVRNFIGEICVILLTKSSCIFLELINIYGCEFVIFSDSYFRFRQRSMVQWHRGNVHVCVRLALR